MTGQLTITSDQVPKLVERVVANYNQIEGGKRYIISLAGVPGAGKTTFSSAVAEQLNRSIKTMVLPQDGFHLYRSELLQLPNPEEAVTRRGAPFTFNVKAFVRLIRKLNDPHHKDTTITAPSFDHSVKDPVEDDIEIDPATKIIILEGNYVSLKDEDWSEIHQYVDESWFITTDLDTVRDRIIKRHLEAGIAATVEEAVTRADGSDLLNAQYILANSNQADVTIVTK